MDVSNEFVDANADALAESMIGPLLFLKIDGDRHLFPPSNSFISSSLYLFLVSLSLGNPLLLQSQM